MLESSWTGAANRQPPDLAHIGRGKLRLRALCILLLLAKYQGLKRVNSNGVLMFQVKIERDTWIYTLGNVFKDAGEARAWIKARFNIHDDEQFVFASPGSTQNIGGSEYPRVEYHPQGLPLSNLHLLVRPRYSHIHTEAKTLLYEDLLTYALKFEVNHWGESATKKFFSYELLYDPPHKGDTNALLDKNEKLANTPKQILESLIENEFKINRKNCQPLYWCVGRQSSHLPYKIWNDAQLQILGFNCSYHAYFSTLATTKFKVERGRLFEVEIRKWFERHNHDGHDYQCRTDRDIASRVIEVLPRGGGRWF